MIEQRKPRRSLSNRLLIVLTGAMLIALVFNIYSILDYVDAETEEVLDARLVLTANNVLRQLERHIREGNLNEAWLSLETIRGLENSWLGEFAMMEGGLFGKEVESAPPEDVHVYMWLANAEGALNIGQVMPGYVDRGTQILQTVKHAGHEWRVAAVHDAEGKHSLYVAQRDDLRAYFVHEIGGELLQKELFSIPLIVLVLWLGINRGLRPLSSLSSLVAQRKPGNLQPILLEDVPREIIPLVESINRLLKRLQMSLESERSFTADAAHELRNPLAVVRNVARILARTHSLEEVHVSAQMLDKSAERMAGLLSQLLHLARLDSLLQAETRKRVVLRTLFEDIVAELMPAAGSKGVQLAFHAQTEVVLYGDEALLRLLFLNLLTNAVKYGHHNAEIRVEPEGTALRLDIVDDGSGVDDSELPHLFERFYRSAEARQQAQGNGLGLSIVKRIVELHGFRIHAGKRAEGGLKVSVLIPEDAWVAG